MPNPLSVLYLLFRLLIRTSDMSSKVLSLGNIKLKYLLFAISLAYSYLCTRKRLKVSK